MPRQDLPIRDPRYAATFYFWCKCDTFMQQRSLERFRGSIKPTVLLHMDLLGRVAMLLSGMLRSQAEERF